MVFSKIRGQVAMNLLVDRRAAQRRDAGLRPPWTNTRPLILTTAGRCAQPVAIVAVAPERLPHLDQPERQLLKELRALLVAGRLQRLQILLADDSESGRDKGGVFAGRGQPQVAEHARGLVVAEQQVQPAARRLASFSSRRTRSSAFRESSPRSTMSPSWTTCVEPAAQRKPPSTMPAVFRISTKRS